MEETSLDQWRRRKSRRWKKPTEANELEDSEAMRRLKAESIPAPSVDFPAVLPPPKPKKVKKESTGRPTQGKQTGQGQGGGSQSIRPEDRSSFGCKGNIRLLGGQWRGNSSLQKGTDRQKGPN